MAFQQRNTVVTLVIQSMVAAFFGIRVYSLFQAGAFAPPQVFRLWAIVIGAVVLLSIGGIIAATIGHSIKHAVRTGSEPGDGDFIEDERDKLIDLKGSRVSHIITSILVFGSMLHFVFIQDGLWLFTLLIGSGLIGQITGDFYKLVRYGQGV